MFVTPVEVDSRGSYVTHDVMRRSGYVSQDVGRRSRRSRRSAPPLGGVHYLLSAFGRDLLLDLRPSPVVAPGFAVHTLGRDGVVMATPGDLGAAIGGCLYQGFIRSETESSAAISTCSGLVCCWFFISSCSTLVHCWFFISGLGGCWFFISGLGGCHLYLLLLWTGTLLVLYN